MPSLRQNVDATYPDSPPDPSGYQKQHQQDHDLIAANLNGVQTAVRNAMVSYEPDSKYAHVQREHLGVQAAIVALTNANGTGDNTIADVGASFSQATLNNNFRDLSDKVNAILAALRATGVILP